MSGGFRAVLPEVLAASDVFGRESRTLSDVVPGGLQAPDGGDGVVNAALSHALQAASLTTGQYAAVVGGYSRKLRSAYDRYQGADDDTARRARQVALHPAVQPAR